MGHEIWNMRGMWVCRRCGRQSDNNDARRALKSSPCNGSAGGRALAEATGNRNFRWNRHALSAAGLLQQGARLVRRSNIPGHMVDSTRLGEMEGEYAERIRRSLQETEISGVGEEEVRVQVGGRNVYGGERYGEGSMPWERDPHWLYLPHLQEDGGEGEEGNTETGLGRVAASAVSAGGHWLRTTGALVWCSRCACFAYKRFGKGLKQVCSPSRRDATRVRLNRLHMGVHPITGERIV